MANNFSILIAGAFYAGKTTFIETISQNRACLTHFQHRQGVVGQSFCGQIKLGDDFLLLSESKYLLEMEGVLGTILGAILIVDSTRPETFRETRSIYAILRFYNFPVLVLANPKPAYKQELDEANIWDTDALALTLQLEKHTPILRCSTNNREEVKQALIHFLELVYTKIDTEQDDPYNEWIGFLQNLHPVLSASEFLPPEREHRWIAIFGMDWWFCAHYCMDTIGGKSVWLRRRDEELPIRVSSIDIDDALSLHIFPREDFAAPRDRVAFALSHVMALQNKASMPVPFEAEEMSLGSAVIGVIGMLAEGGTGRILRASHLADLTRPVPMIFIDYHRNPPSQADIIELPQDVPRFAQITPMDTELGKKALQFLCNYLPNDYGDRITARLNNLPQSP